MNKLAPIGQRLTAPLRWFRSTRRRNKIIVLILLVVLIFGGFSWYQSKHAKPKYEMTKVKKGSITQIVSETGNVSSTGIVPVYSSTNGVIEQLLVKDGAQVKRDQNLFVVHSTATDAEKAAAYSNYQAAISAQKTAEQNKTTLDTTMWSKLEALYAAQNDVQNKNDNDPNPATGQDYTLYEEHQVESAAVRAQKDFKAAEAKVLEADTAINAAKAEVTAKYQAYLATQNATVKAPATGTVANLGVEKGDKVVVETTAKSPVLTIANLGDYTIKLALNEVDIPKVKVGDTAEVKLDAFPGKTFKGSVTHVDAVGTNTEGVVTYNVTVKIDNPEDSMKPGMTADVDIAVDKVDGVLTVPNAAVKPYKGGRAVRVVDPKTKELKYIPVEIGIKGETETQILSGVTEGQEIVTALPNDQLKRPGLFQ